MEPNPIEFIWKPVGKSDRVNVVIKMSDGSFTDTFNVKSSKARQTFENALLAKFPQFPIEDLHLELDKIAAKLVETEDSPPTEGGTADRSDNALLIDLGSAPETVQLFHRGAGIEAEAFARIKFDDHFETWEIDTPPFRSWLRQAFYRQVKRSPAAQAFTDAISTLEAIAIYDGPEIAVHQRAAKWGESIVIDLCNESWSVVIVTPGQEWRVVPCEESPVRFTRKRGMKALPIPTRGGTITELRPFVNFKANGQWVMYCCSLVTMFLPDGPYVILVITGEQGSAKSTTLDRTRALIDPTGLARRSLSRDLTDLMIAAENSHVLSFDNLSHITPLISDALCMLSTGGGMGNRELYTNKGQAIFSAKRPVMLNGIDDVATRADLLDRSVVFDLPAIPDSERREEADLDAEFEKARPRIFGALLDALSGALANYPRVRLERRPRMADYARWAVAAEKAFGFEDGSFMAAYLSNRSEAHAISIENSAVGPALLALIRDLRTWSGTASELLEALERLGDERTKQRKDWPHKPRGMAEALKRISPALRASGVTVETGERSKDDERHRLITLGLQSESGTAAPGPDDLDGLDDVVPTQSIEEEFETASSRDTSRFSPCSKPGTEPSRSSRSSSCEYDPADAAADGAPAPDRGNHDDQPDLFEGDAPEVDR